MAAHDADAAWCEVPTLAGRHVRLVPLAPAHADACPLMFPGPVTFDAPWACLRFEARLLDLPLARDETAPNTKFPPARIGRLLGLLIPLQALLGVAAIHRFPVNLLALALLPLAPLRRRLAQRYPPS